MLRYFSILFILFLTTNSNAEIKDKIIQNLKNTNNLYFNFEQNINGKIENGNCTIQYPKKIFCEYARSNNKILVSNGKSLVIKTITSYYRYPLDKTPLNFILDKKFLISKMNKVENDKNYPFYYIFNFKHENNLIKVFFDKKSLDLIGWETKDIYQNLIQTFLSDIKININVEEKIFYLQKYIN